MLMMHDMYIKPVMSNVQHHVNGMYITRGTMIPGVTVYIYVNGYARDDYHGR